jgi:hypothetical protein
MSKSFSLPDNDIQRELIYSLVDSKWTGGWATKDGTITIHDSEGVSLDKYLETHTALDYHQTVRLAVCLGAQLAVLTGMRKGVLFFSLSDITVISPDWFLLTGLQKIMPMNEKHELTLHQPIEFDGFLAPELEGVEKLPFVTDQSCAYYSLALLCIHAIKIDPDLHQIAETSLYFLLKRCLVKNPLDRIFLFI